MLQTAAGALLFKANHCLHLFLSETDLESTSLRKGNEISDSFDKNYILLQLGHYQDVVYQPNKIMCS